MICTRFAPLAVVAVFGLGCISKTADRGAEEELIFGNVIVEAHSQPPAQSAYLETGPAHARPNLPPATTEAPAATPLTLDACDDPEYADVAYVEKTLGHFTFKYLPGTAAARDLEWIAAVRNRLFDSQATLLGVDGATKITVVLSPNRRAAVSHGYDYGAAWATSSRIEVLYIGTPSAYENRSPGHEIAHVMSSRIDGVNAHIPMLSEGLAEVLDGSGRDPHESYATALRAGVDWDGTSGSVVRFTAADVFGDNYDRAASFVKFLLDKHGVEKFKQLWRASTITWDGWGFRGSSGDLVSSKAELEAELDRLTTKVYGLSLDAVRAEWAAVLAPYLARPVQSLAAADLVEIENVVANVDLALSTGDHARYRSAMEGFYCDYTTDEEREFTAKSAVEGRGTVKTTIVSAWPTGPRNFSTALVHAIRSEERGGVTTTTTTRFWFEHFPTGWRLNKVDSL